MYFRSNKRYRVTCRVTSFTGRRKSGARVPVLRRRPRHRTAAQEYSPESSGASPGSVEKKTFWKIAGYLFSLLVREGKVNVDLAPCRDHTSKALRYGTRSQGISKFYLHTPRLSANGMKHTCLCLPSRSWYSFTDPGGMEG